MPIQRIEAAIERLEAAARHSSQVNQTTPCAADLAEANACNARLREAVGLTLRQLDTLIAHHGTQAPQ